MEKPRGFIKKSFILGSVFIFGLAVGTFSLSILKGAADTNVNYTKNENGLSYGSSMYATSLEDEPDLIQAYGTNGKIGYVLKNDLYGKMPASPNEAVEITIQNQKSGNRTIPLYEKDGKTVIGEFEIDSSENVDTDSLND